MIKAGIAGGAADKAGELLRILVNHPEVEISQVCAPELSGHDVASVHHGLIGEIDKDFTDHLDPGSLDVLFICSAASDAAPLLDRIDSMELDSLRIVDLSGAAEGRDGFVCGISEIFRKQMVRGAKRAVVLSSPAVVALISLYPLAANLLLNSDISVEAAVPEGVSMPGCGDEVARVLRSVQNSFGHKVAFSLYDAGDQSRRGIKIRISLSLSLSLPEVMKLYEGIYDDHNFTFMTTRNLGMREAVGTNKCLITLASSEPGVIEIEAVADACLRGGAGDAVHAMNLLFGLYERTGLALKASSY